MFEAVLVALADHRFTPTAIAAQPTYLSAPDIGVPQQLLRGVELLARAAGLLGHIADEMRNPVANAIFNDVESNAVYVGPANG